MQNICIFDNYDSFTYNLYHLLCKVRKEAAYHILRNNDRRVFDIDFDVLIISPGPMGPDQTGCLDELFYTRIIPERIPVFGVCLGMQFLASFFGGKIVKSTHPVHGRRVKVVHQGEDIFHGIKGSIQAMRYNSLEVMCVNNELMGVLAREEKTGMIMAVRHKWFPFTGVQFHPESFLTGYSKKLIANFFHYYVENESRH
jgi:anthranilate synthase/aminodeoxychorismate synthase-like glutamine amidotransferase